MLSRLLADILSCITVATQLHTSREHARLEDTEEESSSQKTGVVLHKSLADSRKAKEEHVD